MRFDFDPMLGEHGLMRVPAVLVLGRALRGDKGCALWMMRILKGEEYRAAIERRPIAHDDCVRAWIADANTQLKRDGVAKPNQRDAKRALGIVRRGMTGRSTAHFSVMRSYAMIRQELAWLKRDNQHRASLDKAIRNVSDAMFVQGVTRRSDAESKEETLSKHYRGALELIERSQTVSSDDVSACQRGVDALRLLENPSPATSHFLAEFDRIMTISTR